jgi:hypothetical protein
MTKIVDFPKEKIVRDISSINEKALIRNEKAKKVALIQEIVDECCQNIINDLAAAGCNVDNEDFYRDFVHVSQSLESCLLRSAGISHPMQKIYDAILTQMEIAVQTTVDPE